MLESVRCPSCSTHYGLKASRVRPGLRRAKCFRCETIFGVDQEVLRLLGSTAETQAFSIPEQPIPIPAPVPDELPNLDMFFEDNPAIAPGDFEELAAPAPSVPDVPAIPKAEAENPALTLGDLEDEDLMERTLIQPPPEPEPSALLDAALEEEAKATDGGGSYSSARDAISKLMGAAPLPQAAARSPKVPTRGGGQMDVEATLSALETTLGGASSKESSSQPATPAPFSMPDLPAASTLKLSAADIQAALAPTPRMGSMSGPGMPIAPPAKPSPIPQLSPAFSEQPAALPPPPTFESTPSGDPNLLKVQVGTETFQNLSVDQVSRWIEEGRITDYHLVARQFSENWIEAGKVPALRPVFERVKRVRANPNPPETPPTFAPNETAPLKKSLFGGLFKG